MKKDFSCIFDLYEIPEKHQNVIKKKPRGVCEF